MIGSIIAVGFWALVLTVCVVGMFALMKDGR